MWGTWAALVFLQCLLTAWHFAPYCVDDPLPLLEARPPARIFTDRHGTPLYAQRGWDAQWRFPVPLSEIHPEVIRATLAAEDGDFYQHHGVDYRAALRALWQNVTSARTVSGASTISMQVASMAMGRDRTLWGKFLQAARARKMERLHSKDEILSAYLNHLPYGGKLHGIEAAAQFYFGLSARELTFAETTLLCGIPQRPNALRPDRHPEAARQRQALLLKMMVRQGMLSQAEADDCFNRAPVRLRDFSLKASFERIAQPSEHLHALMRGYPIDGEAQAHALRVLRKHLATLPNVHDAACIVLPHSEAFEPLVYLGTIDFRSPTGGQVDAATAVRSAGSVLKPFIFAEAIEGGLLVPETQLLDAPVRYGDYTPTNYDKLRYVGKLSAGEALARSLNTPVIRLLDTLGEERMTTRFTALGLPPTAPGGLTLALGTGGATLRDLVQAYAHLDTHFSPGTAALVAQMLRRPLLGCPYDVAWKTGTANNNTDAWCVVWTPEVTIGVWVGNKTGTRSDALVGVEAAAPIASELMTAYYEHRDPPRWEEITTTATLCSESGLSATTRCPATFIGTVHPTLPLKRCDTCTRPNAALHILAPIPDTYYGERVTFSLSTNLPHCTWLHNGTAIGEASQITLPPGSHTLHAIAPSGDVTHVTLHILHNP